MQAVARLEGMVVIDVVEGTALSSLPYMATVLKQRPSSFNSQEAAVHWARRSGEINCQALLTHVLSQCLSQPAKFVCMQSAICIVMHDTRLSVQNAICIMMHSTCLSVI